MPATTPDSVDERLAWEARYKPKAAVAAVLGGVLTLAGGFLNGAILRDTPRPLFIESLGRAAEPGPIGSQPSLRARLFEFYAERTTDLLLASLVLGIGALLAALALTFLAFATRHRAARFPRFALYLAFVGGVLVLIGSPLRVLGTDAWIGDLLDGRTTVDGIRSTDQPGILFAGSIIQGVGSLILAAGYVIVSLNAMRAGLVPRFLGVLGIFTGLLILLPVIAVAPILQPFWLVAVGVLLAGRWPGGLPPAWRTGRAEPWPSGAQLREQRQAARGKRPPDAVPDDDAPRESRLHPSSKKRKRKRRA